MKIPFRPLFLMLVLQSAATHRGLTAPPRALAEGKLPQDVRLAPPKDLDGYFPFTPPANREVWEKRRAEVRRQLLVALGLFPLPVKSELRPVIHGRRDMGDYFIEKAYFESWPGFFVTGNIYRPKSVQGKAPGVLCPHGHWPDGRFMSLADAAAEKELKSGAESNLCAARSPLQARCVHLARMGCVVFHYDMIGYADSVQFTQKLVHGFAKQRPEMNHPEQWGFFSPQAESRLQSVMGLQAWNGIRALDFLTSLPDVDPARIGVTGASGGGTQTFIMGAIDDRPAAAFPAVMVSTAMQGGCTCENCSLLRVGTGNIEFAGLFSPKPLGMTAANDWTKEMETKGFPELKALYAMLGAADKVHLSALTQFPHNYNAPSRSSMYAFFARHLMQQKDAAAEREFQHLKPDELTVWDDAHPKPSSGDPEFERHLVQHWQKESDAALAANQNAKKDGIRAIFGRDLSSVGELSFDMTGGKHDRGGFLEMVGLVRNAARGEEIPAAFFHPKEWNGHVVLWLDTNGKSAIYDGDAPSQGVKRFLDKGYAVASADLLFQGEFTPDGKPAASGRKVANPREAPAYTYGYNHSLFAQRVHDVLTLVQFVRTDSHSAKKISILALGAAGPVAAAAASQCGDAVQCVAADTQNLRFAALTDAFDPNFFPGGAKYGDLPGMIALFPGKFLDLSAVIAGKELAAWKIISGE